MTCQITDVSIICLICGHESYNRSDINERYCGYCKMFHADRNFPCFCSNCGKKYAADSFGGPISRAVHARCCSLDCIEAIDKKYYQAIIGSPK